MSWFATDDRFWSHRKVIRLRRSDYYAQAVAVWCLAGSWCSGDDAAKHTGAIDFDVIAALGVRDWELGVKALIDVRLFEETADPEVVAFHDWGYWNGPGAKTKRLEQRLEADRVRQQKRRSAALSRDASEDGHVTSGGQSADASMDGHVISGMGKGKGVGSSKGSKTDERTTSSRAAKEPKPSLNDGRDDARRVCTRLCDLIERAGVKRPTVTVAWLDQARLLMDEDGYSEQQVMWILDKVKADPYRSSGVMSTKALREKFGALVTKYTAQHSSAEGPAKQSTTDARVQAAQALKQQLRDKGPAAGQLAISANGEPS